MIYLAIDPGEKRSGLAVGDDETGQAGPVGVIEPCDPAGLLRGVRRAVEAYAPDALVVGVPYNMDGSEGPAAKKARDLARRIGEATGLPVRLVDERLTSYAADESMKQTGLTRKQKKARRDALAAAAILRDFLHRREDGPGEL